MPILQPYQSFNHTTTTISTVLQPYQSYNLNSPTTILLLQSQQSYNHTTPTISTVLQPYHSNLNSPTTIPVLLQSRTNSTNQDLSSNQELSSVSESQNLDQVTPNLFWSFTAKILFMYLSTPKCNSYLLLLYSILGKVLKIS